MATQIAPSTVSTTVTKLPSAVPSLTDWHTWISLLSAVAALGTVLFHKDLSAYVPLAAILVAGLLNAVLMVTKHNYAKALISTSNAIDVASTVAPSSLSSELATAVKVADAVTQIQTALKPIVTAAENPANVAPSTSPSTTTS